MEQSLILKVEALWLGHPVVFFVVEQDIYRLEASSTYFI